MKARAIEYANSIGVSLVPPVVKGGKLISGVIALDSMKQTPKATQPAGAAAGGPMPKGPPRAFSPGGQQAKAGSMALPVDPTVPAPEPKPIKGSAKVAIDLPATTSAPHAPMPTRATPSPERASAAAATTVEPEAPLREKVEEGTMDESHSPTSPAGDFEPLGATPVASGTDKHDEDESVDYSGGEEDVIIGTPHGANTSGHYRVKREVRAQQHIISTPPRSSRTSPKAGGPITHSRRMGTPAKRILARRRNLRRHRSAPSRSR